MRLVPWLLTLLLLVLPAAPAVAAVEEAVLAGGCFWCLEHDLESLPGVVEAVSGFSGGSVSNPTYRQVTAGGTGHIESVRVRFDTAQINLPTLLRAYWRNVDPLDGGGQFCDRGPSYRPVIFSRGTAQRDQARTSLASAARELGLKPSAIKVEIRELTQFWPAEPYHQNYAERNKVQYSYYRWSCGRDRRLDQVWGSRARGLLPWRLKT